MVDRHVISWHTYLRDKRGWKEAAYGQAECDPVFTKAVATKADKSLSQLLREALEEKVNEESEYKKARRSQLHLLKMGLDLGTEGHLKISRAELHAGR